VPADSVRRALADVFSRPEFRWVARRHPLQWLVDAWERLKAWLNRVGDTHPGLFNLIFWAALVALVALLVHIGYTAWRVYRASVGPAGTLAGAAPLAVANAPAHLARAAALAAEGRYAEALAHRFAAVLLQLEDRRALTVQISKTPAEYLAEARLDPDGRETFSQLVARLYRHLFGAVPCDAGGYQAFGAAADSVIQHVAAR
jgi:hypothetical protein